MSFRVVGNRVRNIVGIGAVSGAYGTVMGKDSDGTISVLIDGEPRSWQWHPSHWQAAPRTVEFAAIDAIRAAYMALNACDVDDSSSLVYELTPHNGYDDEATAMGYLAEAGRRAWRQLGIDDVDLWHHMIDNGECAEYNFELWRNGVIS